MTNPQVEHRHSDHDAPRSANNMKMNDTLLEILERLLSTREVRAFLAESLPIVLESWAGRHRLKQTAAKIMSGCFKWADSKAPASHDDELKKLVTDPDFLDLLAQLIAGIYVGNQELLKAGLKTVSELPPREQIDLVSRSLSPLLQGGSADILTGCARLINKLHQTDHTFIVRLLEPGFNLWVQSADFGELKQAVDESADGIVSLVEMANNTLWQYPAKVVLCFALFPAFINILGRSILVSAQKLEEIPPDLLTDIVIALIREIDGATIAALVNTLGEIIHRLHTGSALLGEAGTPQLPRLFSEKLTEVGATLDAATYWQARIQLAELMAALDQAMVDSVYHSPALLEQHMRKSPDLNNIRWRRLNYKLTCAESLDDDEFIRLWSQRLAATDAQGAAEVCNNFLYLANRLAEQNPAAWTGFISRFTHALDSDALAQTASRFFEDGQGDLLPPARAVIPNLLTWICRVLEPADDGFDEDAARARQALRKLLNTVEV